MADIAVGHATAIRAAFSGAVPVMGVSTGASIALQLAADHPHVVSRSVVLCGACRLSAVGHAAQRRALELGRAGRHRVAWRALDRAVCAAGPARWALDAAALTAGELTPSLLALLQAEADLDLDPRLGEITTPTLVAGGERDRPYGRELMARTARGIPGARLVLAPGRGHLGAATDRRLVREALSFLRAGDRSVA
jgi:pimeloyl-ACP methyl ester carboxylesterase